MSARARVSILAVVAAILATIVAPAAAIAAPPAQAVWTVTVYMSGDNNLEDYIVKDLELELAALGSTPNVQVTALADRGPGYDKSRGDWQSTRLFQPTQGMIAANPNMIAGLAGDREQEGKATAGARPTAARCWRVWRGC